MHRLKKRFKIILATVISTSTVVCGTIWGINEFRQQEVNAAEQKIETVNLRVIGTTDLHGQLNSKDYEQGIDYNNGGLARVFDLITKTREELPKENTITLDNGDVLFDYTTEYIFSENQDAIQPIYQAMAMIGYDAITLGNHEFDYGYEYLLRQLNGSGMRDITVVSNVVDSKTGKHPFLENMIITRKLKTSLGNEVEVKVGIIGQTIPTLTSKTHSYAGILKTEDMVLNAQAQAIKLKEMGADIIICLSHTGIGPENPELNFKNVAYALTKIPEVDIVVAGHEHNLFPTTDMTSPYYQLPNVDRKTYLMNGKNVIMAGDRGEAIGVVDLTLRVRKDEVSIMDRKSEIRMVSEKKTVENKTIASLYGSWDERLLNYSTDIIGELEKNVVIQNYYGLLGDNFAIQLLNDSKIHYALKYANTTGKQYKDYPIVAASNYASYGLNSIDDFVNIRDQITESDLKAIQPYNNYLYVYSITGKQLKEWLEWSASAYESGYHSSDWTNETMKELMREEGIKSLIREEWMEDWSSFFIFDGIDYVINPDAPPRYDISGNLISDNRRIKSVTYNGKEVTDTMKLLLVTNKITKPQDANRGIETQAVLKGFTRSQSVLSKYIKELTISGNIIPQVDYNWRVSLPAENKFLIRAPYYANELIQETSWYRKYLKEADQYRYYVASYPKENGDTTGPHIIVAPLTTSATANSFEVSVHVTDKSELKMVRYLKGDYNISYNGWSVANKVTANTFTVWENGLYSIYAEDIHGNKTIKKLTIDNFNENMMRKPTVETYTNRKSSIRGIAEPNSTIVFEAYTGVYESKVYGSGNFSYSLPAQPSGTEVIVYVKDEKNGLESEHIRVPVKRTGPNQPSINPFHNNDGFISGETKDGDATVIAIIDDTVYVSKDGGKELYEKNTEIYDRSLNIVETYSEVFDGGYYMLLLPPQEAGKKITVYSLDHIGRNSRINTTTVSEAAPNAPVVYEVSNIEKSLSGYIPGAAKKAYDITLEIGEKTYNTQTDKEGKFTFLFTDQLYSGQILKVTARDTKNGIIRKSHVTEVIVNDIENYVRNETTILTINRVSNKSIFITGTYEDRGMVYLAIARGEGMSLKNSLLSVETDSFAKFRYPLETNLEAGTKIYAMVRFSDGRILIANKTEVIAGRPETPVLLQEVRNTDKLVQVAAFKDCEVTLTIGAKEYVTDQYHYDSTTDQYIYSFTTDRDVSGTKVSVTATNLSGTSDALTSAVVKAAPDAPKVNPIKEGDTTITGKIELLDYISEDEQDTGDEKLPKSLTNAPSKVLNTRTRIFVTIGKKNYEGTITNKGNFTIEIPKLKADTAVKVWGMNKAGRGPLIKVITGSN
ncbi:5'-nucleotidase C-terminal domain-containing protein [Mobilitalea sibirica]|uniref:5'-nucleotidase C-terminal domain-containing protein n=1 Tax=Mobilitalea sibirica TaxID=1462919 RepID=A0A8J7HDB1_9FIRM|nr:5'-nucleotidase C-terminal domain-containing protein [Mobilitalea sibirica]MBH1940549.1 5'-nucleotidase C-terminal domain-containing protein [Mobilitalea sibirica]